ncbi:uncharacterized protein C5L36_0E03700 [Pichia kudriavzevii]|uniref:Protein kintoun n=1 Tax=Pichia kudriavzevii TaxID=4909 RepID=A0A2U9RA81_PICKU|nr:uncharacterized protein C5L36_0E03700 [Pichia kudriavzevii]AWU78313.1 hypothetical protein C5L36_0E03700 [Pichia kudriavzevii]
MTFLKDTRAVQLEEIELVPHFVIKTKIFTPYKGFLSGTKLFINVCTNCKIPTKPVKDSKGKVIEDFDPKSVFVSISNGEWEIPILTTPETRETVDKKGNKSILIDCVINDKYMMWCMLNEDLKDILVQWCIDAVEFQIGGEFMVDRDSISLPKRTYMGEHPDKIQIDLKHLEESTQELEKLSRDMYEGKDDPINFVNAQRLDELEQDDRNDLPPLIPQESKKSGLIIEVDESDRAEKKKAKIEPAKETPNKSIRFEVEVSKLEANKTKLNHKYELRITSQLQSASDYELSLNVKEKELLIYNPESRSKLNFPLPLDITCEDITSFYVKPEKKLYVYIK